jgi:hypothetical protein
MPLIVARMVPVVADVDEAQDALRPLGEHRRAQTHRGVVLACECRRDRRIYKITAARPDG